MPEKEKTPDLRVLKTKKAIRSAFAELLAEKNIDDITVTDIAERAMINRKTFYNYYTGVYQVIDAINDEIVGSFKEALKEIDFNRDLKNPYVFFSQLTLIINRDMDIYGSLLSSERNRALILKIASLLKIRAKKALAEQIQMDGQKLDVIIEYTISGMLAVYHHWFMSNREESIEEISKLISTLFTNGIAGIMEDK